MGLRREPGVSPARPAAGMRACLVALLASSAWSSPALAGPGAEPVAEPTSAAAPCVLEASVGVLATTGSKEDYLCVASDPAGPAALIVALDALQGPGDVTDGPRNRYTRALTLWLLEHADGAWDPALVRRLSPDDRRLLADGVHARRGRASPAPEHDAIFKNLPWYSPDAGYTNGRLTTDDKAKIALADKPPPPPAPPLPADEGAAGGEPAAAGGEPGPCGCATGSPSGSLEAALLGLGFAALVRLRGVHRG